MDKRKIKEYENKLGKCPFCGEKKQTIHLQPGNNKCFPEIIIHCPNEVGDYACEYDEFSIDTEMVLIKMIESYNKRA